MASLLNLFQSNENPSHTEQKRERTEKKKTRGTMESFGFYRSPSRNYNVQQTITMHRFIFAATRMNRPQFL